MGEKSWEGGHGAAHAGEAAMDGGHGALEALEARQARQQRREEVVEGPRGSRRPVQQAHGLLVKSQLCLFHFLLPPPLGASVLEPHLWEERRGEAGGQAPGGGV